MKNIKKFENWIDDETEDTNIRLSELDKKVITDHNKIHDEYPNIDEEEIRLKNNLIEAARQYVIKYGREGLEEVLHVLMPYGKYK